MKLCVALFFALLWLVRLEATLQGATPRVPPSSSTIPQWIYYELNNKRPEKGVPANLVGVVTKNEYDQYLKTKALIAKDSAVLKLRSEINDISQKEQWALYVKLEPLEKKILKANPDVAKIHSKIKKAFSGAPQWLTCKPDFQYLESVLPQKLKGIVSDAEYGSYIALRRQLAEEPQIKEIASQLDELSQQKAGLKDKLKALEHDLLLVDPIATKVQEKISAAVK